VGRLWDGQVAADLARQDVVDFQVPGDCGNGLHLTVYINGMAAALAQELAAMFF